MVSTPHCSKNYSSILYGSIDIGVGINVIVHTIVGNIVGNSGNGKNESPMAATPVKPRGILGSRVFDFGRSDNSQTGRTVRVTELSQMHGHFYVALIW